MRTGGGIHLLMNANELTATAYGRTFTLTLHTQNTPNLRANLIARGFDGDVFMGEAKPAGRRRSTKHCMFYRSTNPAVGFVPVVLM